MEEELPPQRGEMEHRPEEEDFGVLEDWGWRLEDAWPWKGRKGNGSGVMLEGYVDGWEQGSDGGGIEGGGVGRTKSLTDDDLEELKGCLDLGFGFSYEEIPELCTTLPALELCYSMNQRFLLDEQQQQLQLPSGTPVGPREGGVEHGPGASNPIANWKFSSPGDDPEEVKARLKYWAQAVACTVRLCS
ncbi:hypothetical protein Taro_048172 [Colocasia esculenta]|uniref:Uncharacterized protein n=1 Tax=Colocasia esculenta TaxID=4460 RepID=A0A843X847_COLES|nr:hypothetical protein [Colocasia esculenta]